MGCDSHCSILEGESELPQDLQDDPKDLVPNSVGTTPSSAVLAAVSNRIPMRQRKDGVGLALGSMLATASCILSEIAAYPWRIARYRVGACVPWTADGMISFFSDAVGVSWLLGWQHGSHRTGFLLWRGMGWSFLADSVELGVRWGLETALAPSSPRLPSLARALDTTSIWINVAAAAAAFPVELVFMQSILTAGTVNPSPEGILGSLWTNLHFTPLGAAGQRLLVKSIARRLVRQIGSAQLVPVDDEPKDITELRQQALTFAAFSTALHNALYLDAFSDILLLPADKNFASLCRELVPETLPVVSYGWQTYYLPPAFMVIEMILKWTAITMGSAALWKMSMRTRHTKQQEEI